MDTAALASIINPENEAVRLPVRGTARRTAVLRIPYKIGLTTGASGDARVAIYPMAFGTSSGLGPHIAIYNVNDVSTIPLTDVSVDRYPGPITSGMESFRVNSIAIRFDRTSSILNTKGLIQMAIYNLGFEESAYSMYPTTLWPARYDKYSTRPMALESLSLMYFPEHADAFKFYPF